MRVSISKRRIFIAPTLLVLIVFPVAFTRAQETSSLSYNKAQNTCNVLYKLEQIRGIIAEQIGVDVEQVLPSRSLVKDLGADSLDEVELVMALEDAFDLEISEADAAQFITVIAITEYIEIRLKQRCS